MLVDLMGREDAEMKSLIEKYLNEEDKSMIFKKVQSNKTLGIHGGDAFVLYSNANETRQFVENGHYVNFMAYGLDYMLYKKSHTFSMRASSFECMDDLINFTHEFMFEWYQDIGTIETDLLDKVYAWLLISPYQAMMMSKCVRDHLHKTVEYLWMCTVVSTEAFTNECYNESKRLINGKLDHWFDKVSILRPGCGYANIIEPMEL